MSTTNPSVPPPLWNDSMKNVSLSYSPQEELLKKLDHGQLFKRLTHLRNKATAIPPTEMYLLLNPATILITAEQYLSRHARNLEKGRNILVLVPLLLTWFGLSTASEFYTQTLSVNPKLIEQPFLKMWVEGFPDLQTATIFGTWEIPPLLIHLPSFGLIAALDALLFLTLIFLTGFIQRIEAKAQAEAHDLASWLQDQLFQLETRSVVQRSEGPERELALDRIADLMNRTQEDLTKLIDVATRVATAADRLDIIFQRGQEVYDKLDQTLPHLTEQFETMTDKQRDAAAALQSIATGIQNTAAAVEELARPFATQDLASIARKRDAELQKSVQDFSAVLEKQEKIAAIMSRFPQDIGTMLPQKSRIQKFFKRLLRR